MTELEQDMQGRYLALEATLSYVLGVLASNNHIDLSAVHERLTGHVLNGLKNATAMRPDMADIAVRPLVQATVVGTGIVSGEAFGTASVAAGVSTAALASAEAFGAAALSASVQAVGVASGEALGQPAVGVVGRTETSACATLDRMFVVAKRIG